MDNNDGEQDGRTVSDGIGGNGSDPGTGGKANGTGGICTTDRECIAWVVTEGPLTPGVIDTLSIDDEDMT